jgi:hypothetical protein
VASVTGRLRKLVYPGGASANYLYFPNSGDKRLQQIKNLNNNTNANKNFISEQDYTYDAEGQIKTWTKNYSGPSKSKVTRRRRKVGTARCAVRLPGRRSRTPQRGVPTYGGNLLWVVSAVSRLAIFV